MIILKIICATTNASPPPSPGKGAFLVSLNTILFTSYKQSTQCKLQIRLFEINLNRELEMYEDHQEIYV